MIGRRAAAYTAKQAFDSMRTLKLVIFFEAEVVIVAISNRERKLGNFEIFPLR